MCAQGLKIDFEMNMEHEMVVCRSSGIARPELEEVEIQMLQGAHRMPRLLRMEWTDVNGEITFRYPITNRKLLSHRLQMTPISMGEFYTLLLTVVETIDDCKDYMLRPEGFLLDERAIFVGESWEELLLCYVPIQGPAMSGGVHVSDALQALAVKWLSHVQQPDGEGMKRVFQQLSGSPVSWRSLRRFFLQQIGAEQTEGGGHLRQEQASPPLAAGQARDWNAAVSVRLSADEGKPKERAAFAQQDAQLWPRTHVQPNVHLAEQIEEPRESLVPKLLFEDEGGPTEEEAAAESARMRWIFGAAFAIVTAVIWRFIYLPAGTQRSLLLALGLTLVAGAVTLFLWRKQYAQDKDEADDQADADLSRPWNAIPPAGPSEVKAASAPRWPSAIEREPQFTIAETPPERAKLQTSSQAHQADSWHTNSQRAAEHMQASQGTRVIEAPPQEATVWLGGGNDKEQAERLGGSMRRWLEREADGELEKLEVGAAFRIGRANEGVDYTDLAPGISRIHLEIHASSEEWTVQDVGSRNGSTINGETMIPYKNYPLQQGDVLQLAGEKGPKYILKAG